MCNLPTPLVICLRNFALRITKGAPRCYPRYLHFQVSACVDRMLFCLSHKKESSPCSQVFLSCALQTWILKKLPAELWKAKGRETSQENERETDWKLIWIEFNFSTCSLRPCFCCKLPPHTLLQHLSSGWLLIPVRGHLLSDTVPEQQSPSFPQWLFNCRG